MAQTGIPPRSRLRFPAMLLAAVALLAALWGGFVRLGWQAPVGLPAMLTSHGPLIVSGFLGPLIGVERAVALGRRGPYRAVAQRVAGRARPRRCGAYQEAAAHD